MKAQNYSNHRMYYAPHHFIFLPVITGFVFIGGVKAIKDGAHQLEWALFTLLSVAILYLALMLRQHYALGNQNRIVRLEFRLRYFELMGKPSRPVEDRLTFSQIAALRFANDEEFKTLLQRAINENLSSTGIKKAITDWQGDDMRV